MSGNHDDPQKMELTDVNLDCLEKIIEFLTLEDLINVAESCSKLRLAAGMVFVKNYFGNSVIFRSTDNSRIRIYNPMLYIKQLLDPFDKLVIHSLPTCLKVLRCFGQLIQKLEISYDNDPSNRSMNVDRYIAQYCTESLVEIRIENYEGGFFIDWEKPFLKVESVHFDSCTITHEQWDLNQWFPNMRTLELNGPFRVHDNMREHFANHFPLLDRLIINHFDSFSLGKDAVTKLLQLNPKLKSLKIGFDLVQIASEQLHSVDCLEVDFYKQIKKIQFKNVRSVEVGLKFIGNDREIPISCDRLEELTVMLPFFLEFDLNDILRRFIREHPLLSKLNVRLRWLSGVLATYEDIMELAKAISSVPHITLKGLDFSANEIIGFMNECKLLLSFSFFIENRTEYNILLQSIGTKWRGTVDNGNYVKLEII